MVSGRDVGETLAAQPMTDLADCLSFGVRELQPTFQLRLDDAVLSARYSFRASRSWSTLPVT